MDEAERHELDAGVVWSQLPDNAPLTWGPERRLPYAHDPRLSARLPSGTTIGQSLDAHTARHRAPANVEPNSSQAASWAAEPGDVFVRPADSSEALAWREPTRFRTIEVNGLRGTQSVVVDLVRVELPSWRLAVVERLATYLRVVALDTGGQPTGSQFVTDGCGCYDPAPDFVHPVTQQPMVIRWSLVGLAAGDPTFDGLPGETVPNSEAIQLSPHWTDLRFGWGQRYTMGLQLEVPSGVTSVRLLATVQTAARWRLTVGGKLGVWWVGGGPREAALKAAVSRSGG